MLYDDTGEQYIQLTISAKDDFVLKTFSSFYTLGFQPELITKDNAQMNDENETTRQELIQIADISIDIDTVVLNKFNSFKLITKLINGSKLKSMLDYAYTFEYKSPNYYNLG